MCSQQKPTHTHTHTCKRFIGALFFCLLGFFAASHADVSSVGYIHDQILSQKGLTVPVEAGVSVTQIASEAYLMRQIDAANFLLNGFESSNYADAASVNVVDRDRTLDDVGTLIVPKVPPITRSFTTNTTFVVPAGYSKIDVFAVGGGGAGGGDGNNQGSSGGGGGGGAVVFTTLNVVQNQSFAVVIGAGAAGGSQNAGAAGGTTSFGTVTAAGGAGGPNNGKCYNAASNGACLKGAGSVGTAGTPCPIDDPIAVGKLFGAQGAGGSDAYGGIKTRSAGGNTGGGLGGGGNNNAATNAGGAATFYGAGGGGGAFCSSHSYSVGGAGYQGIVIIKLYD